MLLVFLVFVDLRKAAVEMATDFDKLHAPGTSSCFQSTVILQRQKEYIPSQRESLPSKISIEGIPESKNNMEVEDFSLNQ